MILGPPLVDVVQAVFLFEIIAFLCLSLIRMMKKMAIKSDSPLAGHGISIHGPTESGSGEAAPARPMIRARVYTTCIYLYLYGLEWNEIKFSLITF
jgi:hypothetical protein